MDVMDIYCWMDVVDIVLDGYSGYIDGWMDVVDILMVGWM